MRSALAAPAVFVADSVAVSMLVAMLLLGRRTLDRMDRMNRMVMRRENLIRLFFRVSHPVYPVHPVESFFFIDRPRTSIPRSGRGRPPVRSSQTSASRGCPPRSEE